MSGALVLFIIGVLAMFYLGGGLYRLFYNDLLCIYIL